MTSINRRVEIQDVVRVRTRFDVLAQGKLAEFTKAVQARVEDSLDLIELDGQVLLEFAGSQVIIEAPMVCIEYTFIVRAQASISVALRGLDDVFDPEDLGLAY